MPRLRGTFHLLGRSKLTANLAHIFEADAKALRQLTLRTFLALICL